SRVSSRRKTRGLASSVGSSKVFTNTVPAGKDNSGSAVKPICVPLGSAIYRILAAPSDQKGTSRSYGIRPDAGESVRTSLKAPVWDKSGGSLPLTSWGMLSHGG